MDRIWKHRSGSFPLGRRTLLMGIVNVTPDSFSDGGKYLAAPAAIEHALRLEADGADLVDIGAESTRPGSEPVSASEQGERLLPVLEGIRKHSSIPVSVDTSLADVAATCLKAGASIINDVTGFHQDPRLPEVCAEAGAGVVLMHMRGVPRTMQQDTHYEDLVAEVKGYLQEGVSAAARAGVSTDSIVVDPGLGFGKSFEQNYQLLNHLKLLADVGAGILVGPSRKAFTGQFSGRPPAERQFASAAAVAIAVLNGVDVVRVHDVREMRDVTDILDRYRELCARSRF